MASDIVLNAQETLNNVIDLKVKLHNDIDKMNSALEVYKDQISIVEE